MTRPWIVHVLLQNHLEAKDKLNERVNIQRYMYI